jgi:predicted Kef-type K+ transport protein
MKSMSAALKAAVKRFLKAVFVSGRLLVPWRYEKSALFGAGELIDK